MLGCVLCRMGGITHSCMCRVAGITDASADNDPHAGGACTTPQHVTLGGLLQLCSAAQAEQIAPLSEALHTLRDKGAADERPLRRAAKYASALTPPLTHRPLCLTSRSGHAVQSFCKCSNCTPYARLKLELLLVEHLS